MTIFLVNIPYFFRKGPFKVFLPDLSDYCSLYVFSFPYDVSRDLETVIMSMHYSDMAKKGGRKNRATPRNKAYV